MPRLPLIQLTGAGGDAPWRRTDPLPYTSNPWKLLFDDLALFVTNAWSLPWTIFPLSWDSGPVDELYPSFGNAYTVAVHLFLAFFQTLFLLSLPIAIFCPLPVSCGLVVFYVVAFISLNWLVCLFLLNGFQAKLESKTDMLNFPPHDDEKWIYLNGIAAGSLWLQGNIDRLADTFGRPVTGIHNPTTGVLFDVLECLIQRDFTYATPDIRNAYAAVKEALMDKRFNKVVFILHSQGGIEGGLVLDWLLADVPSEALQKLEVYTFGCAANHFNNPERMHVTPATHDEPITNGHLPNGPPVVGTHVASQVHHSALRYIEHYAHTQEFVARWGVLHFDSYFTGAGKSNRYRGRVFERDAKGHLLNQHYLNAMFPLDRQRGWGCLDNNDFMDSFVDVRDPGPGSDGGIVTKGGVMVRNLTIPMDLDVLVPGAAPRTKRSTKRVGDFSRLWEYRNGGSPKVR